MRIAILTLPLHANYGGILQAYALQTVLERMGHKVCVLQKEYIPGTDIMPWKYPFVLAKRLAYKILKDKRLPLFLEQKCREENSIVCQNTNHFIEKYIHAYEIDRLQEVPKDAFDCIVVGSDQVWRPEYFERMWKTNISDAFLKFTKDWDIKKVAYAASFGVDEWLLTPSVTLECKDLIKMFDGVSVREDSAVGLCSEYFGINPEHVLDPTMLLDAEEYIRLIETANIPRCSGTLFNYILDESEAKRELVNTIARDRGLIPYRMNKNSQDRFAPIEDRIIPSVEEWLRGFLDAEYVVTDSFHGCVFSIVFKKPFLAIGNAVRGMSRFSSLLNMFNLQNHILLNVDSNNQSISNDLCGNICETMKLKQKKSFDFIKSSLIV